MRYAMAMGMTAMSLAPSASAETAAVFDYVEYEAVEARQAPPEGFYRNPVLPGFHPDPSIVRVGSDFYLVTSTFGWFPGLPVFHSTDLVGWRQIGNAIDRGGMVGLSRMRMAADGLYAPAIEFHDGQFYILNTCVRCGGNFLVTARDPAGPWSDPVWLDFEGIDPSLFFDEAGRSWIVNNDARPGEPLYEGHRAIWLQQVDLSTGESLGERHLLVDGGVDISQEPVWAEGPHIYEHDGWYYLSVAEGGTMDQHSQTIYRSRALTGPYEPGPTNPVLTQRDLPAGRADRVEATGHADYVRLDDGSWWASFLAMRPFTGQSTLLGRESWVLPVRWENGWPRILSPGEAVPFISKRPDLPRGEGTDWSSWREEFMAPLSSEWLEMRDPVPAQWFARDGKSGSLLLLPGEDAASEIGKPHFLGRRMRHPAARWTTSFVPPGKEEGSGAGLLAFANEENFLIAGVEKTNGVPHVVVRRRDRAEDGAQGQLVASRAIGESTGPFELSMVIDDGTATIRWRPSGGSEWRELASDVDVEHMASAHSDLFAGVVVGPYAWSVR